MQNWKDLYQEHATAIENKMPEIEWFDLWHNQVNFLTEEHPFSTPALFVSYRTIGTEDIGEKVQKVNLQVDFYLYYETFLDTFKGAYNQQSALAFIDLMDKINATFHGTSGENYSEMRRINFAPVDTGNAGNLYRISYSCVLLDYSAKNGCIEEQRNAEINIDREPFVID
ncbi:hypothetical protein ACSTS3_19600 [Aquimarina muelleri]|uniref:hypothetical protein n=1 Tax=Aquimarina muelleri TaxID=279356 RepID=UPI003F682D7B